MEIQQYIRNVGQQARQASRAIARADTQTKNLALNQIATGIRRNSTAILEANHGDVEAARAAGLDIWADQYPYEATSTSLSALVPGW